MSKEIKKFDTNVAKVLDLMIHSLYTNKDIFLRELISNASDACDKLRYLSQTNSSLATKEDFKITIKLDKSAKTITITDNGIGMNKQELIDNLGSIASSGTEKFLESIKNKDNNSSNNFIGKFGVGFYSSYMVGDKVDVLTRKAGENNFYSWSSEGKGEYSISEGEGDFSHGTVIKVHMKESSSEFLDEYKLKHIVKSSSDYIGFPIYYINDKGEESHINSSLAIWTRNKSDITEEEYNNFYKSVSHAVDQPWLTIHNKNEGLTVDFTNLLFIPSERTFDLFHPDRVSRVKLYIKRVFVTDSNIELVPKYLRFIRGIVDSNDLPLNISRETIQHDSRIEAIKKAIVKKVINELKLKLKDDREQYNKFWHNFGAVIKEGMCEAGPNSSDLLPLCLFHNTKSNSEISLDEYVAEMPKDQKNIYYLSGEDKETLKRSPQIEKLLSEGKNILLFTDHVDDFWVTVNAKYKDYNFISATRSLDAKDISENQDNNKDDNSADHKLLCEHFKKVLGSHVKDIKISHKLTSSPVCLSVDNSGMDIRMEKFLIDQKQLKTVSAKILEINPNHDIIKKISSDLDNQNNINLIKLLFDQACIMEGEPLKDLYGFNQRMIDQILRNI